MESIYGTDVRDTPTRDFLVDERAGLYASICRFFEEDDTTQDISDWDFTVKIRRRPNDDIVLLECTDSNGRLTIDTEVAQIDFNVSSSDIQDFLGVGLARYEIRVDIPNRKNPFYAVRGEIDVQKRIAG